MTVPALAKLEAAFRAATRQSDASSRSDSPRMRRASAPQPAAMGETFSGVGRAMAFFHAKVFGSERTALVVGAESTGIAS